MTPRTVFIASLLAIPLAGLIYRSAQEQAFPSAQIADPHGYPWCYWSGEVKDGKPHGFGAGGCVFGQEPLKKRRLSPPLSQVQYRFLERDDKTIRIGNPADPMQCDASRVSCECVNYHEMQISARIDDYTTFIGNYSHGKREGEGMFFYSDGTTYSGHWRADKREGEGALLNASCEVIYEGQWCADRQGRCPTA